ncbi:MAG: NDP-sugar synthase [Acidimicrobiia bacterium]
MSFDLAGVVLAAGSGTRLAPLTLELPKAMCPVGGVPLVERAIAHLSSVSAAAAIEIAVNAHGSQRALIDHLDGRVRLSIEDPDVLGTGGALARLSRWIDARPVCLVNADAVHDADLRAFVDSWDHERHHFLLAGTDDFAPGVRLCAVLMPARSLSTLVDDGRAASVYDEIWKPAASQQRVSARRHDGAWFDCGTPRRYLDANLWASGGASVVGDGAVVDGEIERSVVWANAKVHKSERLVDAIRTMHGLTVLVRTRA